MSEAGTAQVHRFGDALALHQAGRLSEAAGLYAEILAADPRHFDALHLLGVIEGQRGRADLAERLLAEALAIDPRSMVAAANRAFVLRTLGRLEEALASCDHALAIDGTDVPTLGTRAHLLLDLGRLSAAVSAAARVLALVPDDLRALLVHAGALNALGQHARAGIGYGRALAQRSDMAEAWNGHGLAVLELRGPEAALPVYCRALALRPDDPAIAVNRANALRRLGRAEDGLSWFARSLWIRPDYAEAHYNRALALQDLHRVDPAIAAYRRAVALKPDFAVALQNLGPLLLRIGGRDEAIAALERASAVAPDLPDIARGRLSALLYAQPVGRRFFELASAAAARKVPAEALPPLTNDRDPDRRLKIGFLSSDFHFHPVGRNIRPLFAHRDHRAAEYVCYAHERRSDALAEWYRTQADAWRPVQDLSDREIAMLVRRDRIDVLVILAGYFDHNRAMVAAWRAAPVQVAMHDAATSGIRDMDYFIGDPVLTPVDGSEPFIEKPARLPIFYNHEPRAETPIAARRPATDGAIVFGSFNNPAKLSPTILGLWGRILTRLPKARLVLKYRDDFRRSWLQARVLETMALGPSVADRVLFVAADETEERHLARHADIDIALDSYPFTGATTSFDALWMGVPVITLLGDTFLGRATASHLIPLGLTDLVARTPEDYVELAVALARDTDRLGELRSSLRERLRASPLMDGPGFARSFETLLRSLWHSWVADRGGSSSMT